MLTKEQIAHLFKFCEKHYVYYYEVQVELVDHLANAIEEKMASTGNLAFDDALNKVYADFGVMGFAPIVQEKQNQVFRTSKAAYWKFIKEQLKWPQILRALFFSALLYQLLLHYETIGIVLIGSIIFYGIVSNLFYQIRLARSIKNTGKKFALLNYSSHLTLGFPAFYFLIQVMLHLDEVYPLLYSFLTGYYIVLFIASDKVTNHVKEKLVREYPEAFYPAA
ncbi:MAG TPA: hypothetical protein PL128_02645 [Ginsengibacter sp.]|nr:hypothetical protein [Ginsengibacter sp.]